MAEYGREAATPSPEPTVERSAASLRFLSRAALHDVKKAVYGETSPHHQQNQPARHHTAVQFASDTRDDRACSRAPSRGQWSVVGNSLPSSRTTSFTQSRPTSAYSMSSVHAASGFLVGIGGFSDFESHADAMIEVRNTTHKAGFGDCSATCSRRQPSIVH